MTNVRNFAFAIAFILAPACTSDNLSTKGQLIECSVAADGTTSNCHPTDQTETDDPSKCIDRDEDGDDDPGDEADDDSEKVSHLVTPDDEDGDGTPDTEDDDDDDDGVPDSDDCDEEAGGDSDEPDDDDSVDDDL